jgi:hypothetical protein
MERRPRHLARVNARRDSVPVIGLDRGRATAESGKEKHCAERGKKNRSHVFLSFSLLIRKVLRN